MRRILINTLITVALSVAASSIAFAQTATTAPPAKQDATPNRNALPPGGADAVKKSAAPAASPKLSEAEAKMARGSKAAIIALGISEPYFDQHFKLARVVNAPGDRRVIWKLSINEYETTINDSLGFYTDERGQRVDVYSVTNTLAAAHEIRKTITRREAERALRACIGEYTDGGVTYAAYGLPRRATLMLNGSSVAKPAGGARAKKRREEERRERREREERERRAKKSVRDKKTPPVDEENEEEDEGERPVIYLGVIDLETGKCMKGRATAGAPRP